MPNHNPNRSRTTIFLRNLRISFSSNNSSSSSSSSLREFALCNYRHPWICACRWWWLTHPMAAPPPGSPGVTGRLPGSIVSVHNSLGRFVSFWLQNRYCYIELLQHKKHEKRAVVARRQNKTFVFVSRCH